MVRLDEVPEDIIREIKEYEENYNLRSVKRVKKKPYPSARDIVQTVMEAIESFYGHPDEFPDYVLRLLETKGFCTRHVTVKRIWRTYETLVKRGIIRDKLNVVIH